MASTSDTALKAEIARLTGAINQHKQQSRPFARSTQAPPSAIRDVVIDGVAFQSSSRSLVRKGRESPSATRSQNRSPPVFLVTNPPSSTKVPFKPIPQPTDFSRTVHGHRLPAHRAYKPKVSSRPHQQRPRSHNMTLDNTRRPTQGRQPTKRMKYLNKPCPRFTTTDDTSSCHGCSGACSRGLTCMYQHDPNKIAICWHFLHGNCPNTAASCNLSHDPTPERTPLCVHFANNGRCTRVNCPFPHVRVGQRHGVCRDFAVLGYCSKGLDCEMQHVRECPDFAETGTCSTKGCKLPHVIRANRNRKAPTTTNTSKTGAAQTTMVDAGAASVSMVTSGSESTSHSASSSQQTSFQDAQLGDEFISLMFNESEESDDNGDDDSDATDAEAEDASDEEEGLSPTVGDGPETCL